MAENYKIIPLRAQAGIKKDVTDTEGNYWTDGLWSRFYRGLPRSMPGYRSMSESFTGTARGLFVNPNGSGYINIFNGSASKLEVGQFSQAGFGSGVTDITPGGFAGNTNNAWQFDSFYNSNGGGSISIIAHAAPNLATIDSNIAEPVYYGDINSTSALTASVITGGMTPFAVSGGVVSLQPYLIAYGSLGLVAWCALNDPTNFPVANAANVCATKIVKGLPIRGGSSSPSCLLWSLDSLIQMSFVGGSAVWNFNTISDQSSILSSSGVVEMDGVYYWTGLDRFLVFNGVLRELPNLMNLDFFYTNLNYAQRQKVFAFKIPRWGEICWCAPLFGSTECNWMFVYNVRENTWYDTPLPIDGRSAAYFAQNFPYPVMASANGLTPIGQNSGLAYPVWQHEFGFDAVRGNVDAIRSYIKSPDFSIVGGGMSLLGSAAPSDDVWTELVRIEPDFKGLQQTITCLGREFAMDADAVLDMTTINAQSPRNFYDVEKQARYLRFLIESNSQGSSYQLGQTMIGFREGDRR